jgi:hypothetical protein
MCCASFVRPNFCLVYENMRMFFFQDAARISLPTGGLFRSLLPDVSGYRQICKNQVFFFGSITTSHLLRQLAALARCHRTIDVIGW